MQTLIAAYTVIKISHSMSMSQTLECLPGLPIGPGGPAGPGEPGKPKPGGP